MHVRLHVLPGRKLYDCALVVSIVLYMYKCKCNAKNRGYGNYEPEYQHERF